MKLPVLAAITFAASAIQPALAERATGSAPGVTSSERVAGILSQREREAYRFIFADIRAGNAAAAEARLAALPSGVLHPVARAQLHIGFASLPASPESLAALLAEAPDLPAAEQLAGLAASRGMGVSTHIPQGQPLYRFSGPSRRLRAQPVSDDPVARSLAAEIGEFIQNDSPRNAETLIAGREGAVSPEGLTELRQRIAWSYYLTGDDSNARRLAHAAARGSGEWAVHASWVEGLAAWRQRDCAAAASAFGDVGRRGEDSELMAAGLFWAARAELACGHPQNVQPQLRAASRYTETFYGMLAAQSLGILPAEAATTANALQANFSQIESRANVRRATALSEIGERALADQVLRHEAGIGDPRHHGGLIALAGRLNLPETQLFLSQNGPSRYSPGASARYPAPAWRPTSGWRVDQSLVYAHALQESAFRPDAVSHAGARGLMQLMPGTAEIIARRRGETIDANLLNVPEVNIEYGQSYLEQMRDFGGNQGMLCKVIASYNAGPGAVLNWEGRLRDRGDPLLYIESIPFIETRHYVPIVLRNYWMYQRNAGDETSSLAALAQGMWPRFPGTQGATAVRLSGSGTRLAD